MLRPISRPGMLAVAAALIVAACSYPTDNSTGAWVTVIAPSPVLIRGNDTLLTAHVYLLEHGHDTVEVKNVEVTWTSSDSKLATITALPGRMARVTGVNPGDVTIGAVAAAFQSAKPAALALRVADPLEVDSVSPRHVTYGDTLSVFGVGAETVDALFLESQALTLNGFSGSVDSAAGTGRRSFFVGFPARTGDTLTAIGNGIVATLIAHVSVTDTVDLFDPNMTSPHAIDLDAHPYAPLGTPPTVLRYFLAFYNPTLFAEDPRGAAYRDDWFRMTTPHPDSAYTFLYFAPALFGRQLTFLSAPVTAAEVPTGGSWTYGSGRYRCKGYDFNPAEVPSAVVQVAFTKLPPGGVDLVSLFIDRGPYGLVILRGYFTSRGLRPDRFEGDNTCDLADSNFVNPALHIDAGTGLSDTLNIDNAFEIDWLKFHVPGAAPQLVTVKLASKSLDAAPNPNLSDIVLYVLNVPSPTVPLSILKSAVNGGPNKSLTVLLDPGDYYLVAHDSVGVPARYAICLGTGVTCTLPSLPDAVSPAVVGAARGAATPAEVLEAYIDHALKRRPPR